MVKCTLKVISFFVIVACETVAYGDTNVPFSRGFNLTNWFQVSSPQQIQFSKYTKQDFENIKSLGCDVIRLPINLHSMTSGEPDYTLDPLFLTFLDEVVGWAEELEMHLILDNHKTIPTRGWGMFLRKYGRKWLHITSMLQP